MIEFGVLTVLIGGRHQGVPLVLKPFSDPQLVLGCSEHLWDFLGMLPAIVENQEDFGLLRVQSQYCSCCKDSMVEPGEMKLPIDGELRLTELGGVM